jgi:WD40 repeat protein
MSGKGNLRLAIILALSLGSMPAREGLFAAKKEALETVTDVGTDQQGDPLPPGAVARLGTVRCRLTGSMQACAFSPDGKLLAVGTDGVELVNPKTWQQIGRLPSSSLNPARALAFSPDGKLLASVQWQRVRLHDVAGRKLRGEFPAHQDSFKNLGERKFEQTRHDLSCVAFAPDGKSFATGCWRRHELRDSNEAKARKETASGIVRLWDLQGRMLHEFPDHQHGVTGLAFSPDGRLLVSASYDHKLRFWDVKTGKLQRPPIHHAYPLMSVVFSPDGKLLACCGQKQIHVYDMKENRPTRSVTVPEAWVNRLAFSPDGRKLAAACDRAIRLFDGSAGKLERAFPQHAGTLYALAFTADGQELVAGTPQEHAFHVWDVTSGKARQWFEGHTHYIGNMVFSPDSRTLVTGSDWDKTVRYWDVCSGKQLHCLPAGEYAPVPVAFSAQGKTLLLAKHGEAQLWDVPLGKKRRTIPGDVGYRQGRYLAMLQGGKLAVWDTITHKARWEFAEAEGPFRRPVLSPDGTRLAAIVSPKVRLWHLPSGKYRDLEIYRPSSSADPEEGPKIAEEFHWLAFSPNSRLLATGDRGLSIRLWDVETGRQLCDFGQKEHQYPPFVAFSPDGRLLASGGGDSLTRLWETASGTLVRKKQDLFAGFSPDGRFLALGGGVLVDVISGEIVRKCQGQENIDGLVFSPCGKYLATSSYDTTILIWDLQWSDRPKVAPKPFTRAELLRLWEDLASRDCLRAYQAMSRFCKDPGQAVHFIQERLQPVKAPDGSQFRKLIADLNNQQFAVREEATKKLAHWDEEAEPYLRQALKNPPSEEVRRRLQALLQKLASNPRQINSLDLRRHRALHVLEHIGSARARQVLEGLAKGAEESSLTRDAKESVARLCTRQAARRKAAPRE